LVRPNPPLTDASDASGHVHRGREHAATPLPAAEPPPPGNVVLDELHAFLCRYVAWPDSYSAVAVTLWCAHAHALEAFDSTPRLAFLSPEPQSGKSRAQEVVESLVPAPLRTSNVTSALLFRLIDERQPTILIDEVDTIWTAKGQAEDLRAIINAGHRRGNDAARMVGEGAGMKATTFKTYAAVCLAGIGNLPGTIADRSVIIRMKRRRPADIIEPWRFRACEPAGHRLRDRLAAWSAGALPTMRDLDPEPLPGVQDRSWDVWLPLLVVADAAGGRWPLLARQSCEALSKAATDAGPPSPRVRLLADLLEVWPGPDRLTEPESFAPTDVLLARLHALTEAPWGAEPPLSAKRLATMLRPYGVRPSHSVDKGTRGYLRADLADPWERYLTRTLPLQTRPEASEASADAPVTIRAMTPDDELLRGSSNGHSRPQPGAVCLACGMPDAIGCEHTGATV
jgi:Protein of unknown function (DUF3631)